eukprot:TRINITY_DN1755_c0_g1_i1.p1 TRINITY_DN1755_c0_g1~~TRINITY_DN1755_c0_g1_i1.p1  ORF type:complete len:436 (-),score=85.76 TRINITY_DN1755_c0_g1_i1:28-1296(-)
MAMLGRLTSPSLVRLRHHGDHRQPYPSLAPPTALPSSSCSSSFSSSLSSSTSYRSICLSHSTLTSPLTPVCSLSRPLSLHISKASFFKMPKMPAIMPSLPGNKETVDSQAGSSQHTNPHSLTSTSTNPQTRSRSKSSTPLELDDDGFLAAPLSAAQLKKVKAQIEMGGTPQFDLFWLDRDAKFRYGTQLTLFNLFFWMLSYNTLSGFVAGTMFTYLLPVAGLLFGVLPIGLRIAYGRDYVRRIRINEGWQSVSLSTHGFWTGKTIKFAMNQIRSDSFEKGDIHYFFTTKGKTHYFTVDHSRGTIADERILVQLLKGRLRPSISHQFHRTKASKLTSKVVIRGGGGAKRPEAGPGSGRGGESYEGPVVVKGGKGKKQGGDAGNDQSENANVNAPVRKVVGGSNVRRGRARLEDLKPLKPVKKK